MKEKPENSLLIGAFWGLVFSVPLWGLIIYIVWRILGEIGEIE